MTLVPRWTFCFSIFALLIGQGICCITSVLYCAVLCCAVHFTENYNATQARQLAAELVTIVKQLIELNVKARKIKVCSGCKHFSSVELQGQGSRCC